MNKHLFKNIFDLALKSNEAKVKHWPVVKLFKKIFFLLYQSDYSQNRNQQMCELQISVILISIAVSPAVTSLPGPQFSVASRLIIYHEILCNIDRNPMSSSYLPYIQPSAEHTTRLELQFPRGAIANYKLHALLD